VPRWLDDGASASFRPAARMRARPAKVAWSRMEPDGATLLWLRTSERAPVNAIRGAPKPEPGPKRPFGGAPPGAAPGAGLGALPKRLVFWKMNKS
jgi:hypothetical protein